MNNWYIITGAPCSGKTTTLQALAKQGHKVIYEVARTYIDEQLKLGNSLAEIRKDELLFQKKILQYKIDIEKTHLKKNTIFFERGIPDSVAYYNLCGVHDDKDLQKAVDSCRYRTIFLLHPLPYKKDYARTESEKEVQQLHYLLKESYIKAGMPITEIPVMSIQKRVALILSLL